jgi:hypothetical protein
MENHEAYGPLGVDSVGGRVASGIAEVAVRTAKDFIKAIIPDELKSDYHPAEGSMPTIILIKEDAQRLNAVRAELDEIKRIPAGQPPQCTSISLEGQGC